MDFAFLAETAPKLLKGLPLTIELAVLSLSAGFCLALCLGVILYRNTFLAAPIVRGFVAIFRGTPLLVQIFLVYYGLGQFRPTLQALGLWTIFRDPFWCVVLALTLNTAAYGAEIIRGGLMSVPHGQIEAARACGMSGLLLYRRILLPVALRQALPAYGSEIILIVKGTSLASIVTLAEVTGIAYKIISETYRAIEVFACAGAIYLVLNFAITRVIGLLEYSLSAHLRPRPVLATAQILQNSEGNSAS
jgi:octopine/nopaline transport system permease protein